MKEGGRRGRADERRRQERESRSEMETGEGEKKFLGRVRVEGRELKSKGELREY